MALRKDDTRKLVPIANCLTPAPRLAHVRLVRVFWDSGRLLTGLEHLLGRPRAAHVQISLAIRRGPCHAWRVPENRFDEWIAQRYEVLWPELFDAAVLDPAVDFLVDLAGAGRALEFGIGTGRVALPLSGRGVRVHGIELSAAMVAQLETQQGASDIGVTIGDFATTTVDGTFTLVYLLRNTITNLTTQDEQVACFRNAAAHLEPGGSFVIENYIPELRRLPPGETRQVFTATPTHIGVGEYDVATQIEVSNHWWVIEGQLKAFSSPHRYVWPSELDLMARLARMALRERWSAAQTGHLSRNLHCGCHDEADHRASRRGRCACLGRSHPARRCA